MTNNNMDRGAAAELAEERPVRAEVSDHLETEGEAAGETEPTHSIKKPSGWNSFFRSVAPDVMKELGEGAKIGQVSTVVGKMWEKLPADRRKDWGTKAQRTREDLDTGLAEEKKCANCHKSYATEKHLKYHQKGCHEYICGECDERFNHELKLKRHIAKIHRELYKCNKCDKTFSETRNLTRHQKTHNQQ